MTSLYAVILAGGSGTRFWPLSRRSNPKQLLKISQSSSMLQLTVERLQPLIPYERIIVITTKELMDAVKQQLPQIPEDNILVEIVGRNTSAAIALASFYLKSRDPQSVMVVLPADHSIKNEGNFREIISYGNEIAKKKDYLITLGITPDNPHTGYGYLICGESFEETLKSNEKFKYYKVDSVIEKPSLEKAHTLLFKGALWNSGMFIWRVDAILAALKKFVPEIYHKLEGYKRDWPEENLAEIYPRLPAISIDYGVMEKADNVVVFPANLGWNDLGSWDALGELFAPDEHGNICPNEMLHIDSHGVTIYSPDKLVVSLGVNDVIVVDTEDVLLLCSKDRAQDIKKLVELIEKKDWHEYL